MILFLHVLKLVIVAFVTYQICIRGTDEPDITEYLSKKKNWVEAFHAKKTLFVITLVIFLGCTAYQLYLYFTPPVNFPVNAQFIVLLAVLLPVLEILAGLIVGLTSTLMVRLWREVSK
ncbi:MAG: hypothetical protein ACPGO5_04845 [Patescibacteria group bacterium]